MTPCYVINAGTLLTHTRGFSSLTFYDLTCFTLCVSGRDTLDWQKDDRRQKRTDLEQSLLTFEYFVMTQTVTMETVI